MFFRHRYLPKTLLSYLGTTFVSDLMHELTKLLERKLEHFKHLSKAPSNGRRCVALTERPYTFCEVQRHRGME